MSSPSRMSMRGQNPRVNGFALILTNDYEGISDKLPTLKGTRIDGLKMCNAMQELNFETHWEHNASASVTRRLIREAARCQYLPNYRRLALIFSGHGTTNHSLYTQDGKDINFHDVLTEFYPDHSPHIGTVPKLFFIDACRGPLHTLPVLVCKGSHDVTLKVPEKSNFLVAYSTMPEHRVHELEGQGSVWITYLAEQLKATEASVLDVLTRVNRRLCLEFHSKLGLFQQPELISRLNEEVHLLTEAKQVLGTCLYI